MYDVQTGQQQQVAAHDAPIRCCEYLDMQGGMLVTAGWDKKLKVNWRTCAGGGELMMGSVVLGFEDAKCDRDC